MGLEVVQTCTAQIGEKLGTGHVVVEFGATVADLVCQAWWKVRKGEEGMRIPAAEAQLVAL